MSNYFCIFAYKQLKMAQVKLTENELLKLYRKKIDKISDEYEWKTHFSGEEVCGLVCSILADKDKTFKVKPQDLYSVYSNEIEILEITDEEWVRTFGIPEIIALIYQILEDKFDIFGNVIKN